MTLQELHERIGWQLEGRLQHLMEAGTWTAWEIDCPPSITQIAGHFRRRPDPPPMPDEVWVPAYTADIPLVRALYDTAEMCRKSNNSATPIRYVRADGIIDGAKLLERFKSSNEWSNPDACEYRFKP